MTRKRPRNSTRRAMARIQSLVRIEIEGYNQDEPGDLLPRTRDDEGLVADLVAWLIAESIHAVHTPFVGGGNYSSYFKPDDAERVVTWLKEHNTRC